MPATSTELSAKRRAAAHRSHVDRDGHTATAAARAASLGRFKPQAIKEAADAGFMLDEVEDAAEIERRAEHLKQAFYAGMVAKSIEARRAKAGR